MSESKLMARLRLSPAGLREMLHLPPGADPVRVEVVLGARGTIDIVVEGAGWPTAEGGMIQRASAIVTRAFLEDGRELAPAIKWNFPE